jgi:hypothetical protein
VLDQPGGGILFGYGSGGYNLNLNSSGQLALSDTGVDAVISGGATITDTSFHHVAVTKNNTRR